MLFGLKIWSINTELIDEAVSLIQSGSFAYLELMPVPKTRIDPFLQRNIPYIIHSVEVDIADPACREQSRQAIQECLRWADALHAPWVVLHPWRGDIHTATKFVDDLNDSRIIIENMPYMGLDGFSLLGSRPDEIECFKREGNCGFCLDLSHAIKAACAYEIPYPIYLDSFVTLNPTMFHLSDGTLDGGKDEHFAIGKGEYDMKFLLDLIACSGEEIYVTLEVPKHHGDFREAIDGREELISLLQKKT